jgi:hypothetical protein
MLRYLERMTLIVCFWTGLIVWGVGAGLFVARFILWMLEPATLPPVISGELWT